MENTELMRNMVETKFSKWCQNTYQKYSVLIEQASDFVAEIAFIQCCSKVAIENGYCRPIVDTSDEYEYSYVDATDVRHPIIEKIQTDIQYVPNDFKIGMDTNGYLLYGVNATGKSSYMKSIGINIIMAQSGMYVPSSSFKYKPFKYLFTRIQSNDNLFAGQSSFVVEMTEFRIIMKHSDRNSIILGDELCHGTQIDDATALVTAGVCKLAERKANFLFATHLHSLSNSKHITELDNVENIHMSILYDNATNKFTYVRKIQDGAGISCYGILVCSSLGLDKDYIDFAQEIRNNLTGESQTLIGKQSKYNPTKYISMCEICTITKAIDTHHIYKQCTADENNMIEHWHKDNKFNLVGLCKPCHQSVHSEPPRLQIKGYIKTSDGIELEYRWL